MRAMRAIHPDPDYPFYWNLGGQTTLLLGGSVEDNLFQIEDLEEHLDLLVSCGGNYIRCTMSSRDPGDVWPFEQDPATGRYDLERPGEEYWERFERCVRLCHERAIVLQLELWDRFDFARAPWEANPFNPKNNVNYTCEQCRLPESIDSHPGARENGFFRTVPVLEDNALVRRYQEQHLERLLAITHAKPHVLYCIDNETNEDPAWPTYWADFVKARQPEAAVTEMWDHHDLSHEQHARTWQHPEKYDFCDVSQNNHQVGRVHWDNLQDFRARILETGKIRPLNMVKIYGANTGAYGSTRDAQERLWRAILGGAASARFHRPAAGIGLGPIAQSNLRSARMLTDILAPWHLEPRRDALNGVSVNEAYAATNGAGAALVYFTDGGQGFLDLGAETEAAHLRWLDVRACAWHTPVDLSAREGQVWLQTPREEGYWAAVVMRAEEC